MFLTLDVFIKCGTIVNNGEFRDVFEKKKSLRIYYNKYT